jgi:hypothetical protein
MAHSSLAHMPYISHQMSAQHETRELDLRYNLKFQALFLRTNLIHQGHGSVALAWLHKQYPNVPSLEAMSIGNRVSRVESHLRTEIPDLCRVGSFAVAKGVQGQHDALS